MFSKKIINIAFLLCFGSFLLNSCAPFNSVDAKKFPPDPKLRVKKNMEEGRGFRLMDKIKTTGSRNFEFASSNELWRASLDAIDFMPLASVNYSGGIIITDWYSNNQNTENIKITIRFLTNEIRSDALDIKVFRKTCNELNKCNISEISGEIKKELKRKILKTAKIYEAQKKDKNFKPYEPTKIGN
tara:strand:- start:399 stop:956 length:558 start_codon:yes stop_codon:yes gene_type:complete